MAKSRLAHGRHGRQGRAVGPAAQAQIFSAIDVAFDASGRKIDRNRIIATVAGSEKPSGYVYER